MGQEGCFSTLAPPTRSFPAYIININYYIDIILTVFRCFETINPYYILFIGISS